MRYCEEPLPYLACAAHGPHWRGRDWGIALAVPASIIDTERRKRQSCPPTTGASRPQRATHAHRPNSNLHVMLVGHMSKCLGATEAHAWAFSDRGHTTHPSMAAVWGGHCRGGSGAGVWGRGATARPTQQPHCSVSNVLRGDARALLVCGGGRGVGGRGRGWPEGMRSRWSDWSEEFEGNRTREIAWW